MEQTLLLFKPDANIRNLIRPILDYIVEHDFRILDIVTTDANRHMVLEHYRNNLMRNNIMFLNRMTEYFELSPILAIIVERENAIFELRKLAGASDPSAAGSGTIRGIWGIDSYKLAESENRSCYNLVHTSDSEDSFKREKKIWFGEE